MSENSFDKSDKELDEILKRISDNAELPFSEEDWAAMESRLDAMDSLGSLGWKRAVFIWAGAVLFAGMISYMIWDPKETSRHAASPEKTEQTRVRVPEKEAMPENNVSQADISEPGTVTMPESIPLASRYNFSYRKGSAQETSYVEAPTTAATLLEKAVPLSMLPIPEMNLIPVSPAIPEALSFGMQANKPPSSELRKFPEEDDLKTKTKERFGGKFNLSVQLAPDISAIQLNQLGKAGNAVGIGAEYFIRPKISLMSGVFYSYKPYSGSDGYHINYGKEPSYVTGICDVLDIPVNLRYYLLEGQVQRFFVSTGLSTYLMLKEHYELEYNNSGPEGSYLHEVDVRGANQHYFGIANFSIGYERKLGRQLGIQVEPYFKAPLSGVGEGDVLLKSTGIFVGLKYYPGKALKP